MTIRHHPPDDFLTGFAAGTLDLGQHVAIATHLTGCSRCRRTVRLMEHVGGSVLAEMQPTPMSDDALARVEARMDQPVMPAARIAPPRPGALDDLPELPAFVRRYAVSSWKWIAPGLRFRPIQLPTDSPTRVFLLQSAPGTAMLDHTHTGQEMTCVLRGGFQHRAGQYGPGDFDLGDSSRHHDVVVDAGEACLCLVAMHGKLRLSGLLGAIVQPFLRL